MRRAPRLIVLAAVLAAPAVPAADCDFLPKARAPAWVSGKPGAPGYYTGVGQAPGDNDTAAEALERAKQAALRDLASNIEVRVKSELRVQETAAGTPGDLQSRIEVESSTQTAASALLGDVETDGSWLDRRACVVWMRVKIAEPVVRALQKKQTELTKLKLLQVLVQTAEDPGAAVDAREKALAQADSLVGRVDYSYATDGASESLFRAAIERARGAIGKARGRFEINARDFAQAEEGLQRARRETGAGAQAALATGARDLLTRVSASAPYGTPPDFWPEKATWALAEFERDTGNPCEARHLLQELARRTGDPDWRTRAEAGAAGLSCGEAERETRALRRLVFGRDVTLLCAYKLAGGAQNWDRACADAQALLAKHGARKVSVPQAGAAQMAKWVEQCRNGCREPALSAGVAVVLYAQGSMATRKNAENPMGQDHQFKGQVTTYVLADGKAEFNDQYSGIGGWNPVSGDMAMDVLAIQAARRFREKATAHYAPEG